MIPMNRLYDVADVGTVQIALSGSAARAITPQLFFSCSRSRSSHSFSPHVLATWFLPVPTSLTTHVPRETPGSWSRVIYVPAKSPR